MKLFRRHPPVRRALDPHTGKPIPKPTLAQRLMLSLLSRKLRPFLASRKTTLGGIVAITGALGAIATHLIHVADGGTLSWEMLSVAGSGLAAGFAGLVAKDADKTGIPKP